MKFYLILFAFFNSVDNYIERQEPDFNRHANKIYIMHHDTPATDLQYSIRAIPQGLSWIIIFEGFRPAASGFRPVFTPGNKIRQ